MELPALLDALSDPAAYGHPVKTVEVRHTHISAVFLAGPFAYKIKKPVHFSFVDFSSLEKRLHFCREEVRLNRRLAPEVYSGVVPVARSGLQVRMEGKGEVIEWAVKMQRLPEDATLEKRLERGQIEVGFIQALARKVASFHAQAEAGMHISAFGRLAAVAQNARENLEQVPSQVGTTISKSVLDRLHTLNEEALIRLGPLIEARALRGVPRDTHGDLHLDHVYLFPERPPPGDLVIIDCIEFNERFRYADPVADMAFLAMDLCCHRRRDLAAAFADEYFQASGDAEGRSLLPFYVAYRAAVRGKVDGLELLEREIPEGERTAALGRARGHWLLALGALESPGRKPCLVLVGGLPGTGKTTLAHDLAERAGFTVIRSDVVRKELAGLSAAGAARFSHEEGIYTPRWTERTYAECLARAEALLFEGKRVIVDASFGRESSRRAFLEAAAQWQVPGIFLLCRADAGVVRLRLESRRGDVSDADWSIYQKAAQRWEPIASSTQSEIHVIPTNESRDCILARALAALGGCSLLDQDAESLAGGSERQGRAGNARQRALRGINDHE
jgi:aminoglycoside phosphotransferase family enzyme/predicted kinase